MLAFCEASAFLTVKREERIFCDERCTGAGKGGGVLSSVKKNVAGLSGAVVIATGLAAATMTATAGLSVLASDTVSAAADVYGPQPVHGGKRCVRSLQLACVPAPDACNYTLLPAITELRFNAMELARPLFALPPVRPLSEADEVPENFI